MGLAMENVAFLKLLMATRAILPGTGTARLREFQHRFSMVFIAYEHFLPLNSPNKFSCCYQLQHVAKPVGRDSAHWFITSS